MIELKFSFVKKAGVPEHKKHLLIEEGFGSFSVCACKSLNFIKQLKWQKTGKLPSGLKIKKVFPTSDEKLSYIG